MMDVDDLAIAIHQTAVDHGFWTHPRNLGEMLMLVVSECAEALEEDRDGKPLVYWKCKDCGYETDDPHDSARYACENGEPMKPEGSLVEVIDAIIRLFDTGADMARRTQYRLSDVLDIKMDYNKQREHMHGKAY